MERPELLEQLFRLLEQNRFEILMEKQPKFCGPCGGVSVNYVYKSPIAAQIGGVIDSLKVL